METQTETETTEPEVVTEEATTDVTVEPEKKTETPERQPNRRDRKNQRIDVESAQRERDEFKNRLEAAERRDRERERELAEVRGRLEERAAQGQQQNKHAETKSKIETLRDQAWTMMERAAMSKTPEESAKFRKEHQRLMDEADDLRDEIRAGSRWEKQRGEIGQALPDPQAQAERSFLDSRFPWLASNPKAQMYADVELKSLIAAGEPATRETAIKAITTVANYLKLGGTSSPTNGQRQLYSGVPSGEGAGGDDKPRSIRMGRHEEALARATYPQLEAREAYKQWAKDMVERQNDEG